VLRHTALAEANDRSRDLRTVQEIARHSRPETTAGYTRTTSRRMAAVVAMIDYGRNQGEAS
jgi:integrase